MKKDTKVSKKGACWNHPNFSTKSGIAYYASRFSCKIGMISTGTLSKLENVKNLETLVFFFKIQDVNIYL